MRDTDFQNWHRERDAVEQEMDRLISAGLPASVEERQVRRTQFVALIERREAAARRLLQSDRALRLQPNKAVHRHKSSENQSRANDWLSSEAFGELRSEGEGNLLTNPRNVEGQSGLPPDGLVADTEAPSVLSFVPLGTTAAAPDTVSISPDADANAATVRSDDVALAPDLGVSSQCTSEGDAVRAPDDLDHPSK